GEALVIRADGRLLWRVFDNLLSNICKYTLPGTRVYIEAQEEDGIVRICFKNVSAQMLGIDAQELTERFVRGDSSRSTQGSGLGLSIAQSLTALQGGRFSLSIDGDLFTAAVEFARAPENA
ncbi:MAG: sensor histidine kinase, partial [Oscillospiraceae bacterium]|nr:sensor histidine kinase [Oscillospiraceae bacterium]